MKKTAIVYSTTYLKHNTGKNHPESPQRLKAIMSGLEENGILGHGDFSIIKPRAASIEELEMVHSRDYIESIRKASESGGCRMAEGTIVSRKSFEVARLAAGGTIEAVKRVVHGDFRNAFALVRPPGHHAGPEYALGFCLFNNVSLAATYLIREFGLKRVLVLDIDSHHGNGTQEIFYGTSKVLYVSLHEDPSEFPETGFLDETGEGEGKGYTVNVALPFRTGDRAYLKALENIVMPIAQQYRPQFVLVSAGFDGYYRDSVGELSLSAYVYPRVFHLVLDLAHRFCKDRVVVVLEGGYRLTFLRRVVPAIVAQMAGLHARVRDRRPLLNWEIQKEAEKTVEYARRVQSRFWDL